MIAFSFANKEPLAPYISPWSARGSQESSVIPTPASSMMKQQCIRASCEIASQHHRRLRWLATLRARKEELNSKHCVTQCSSAHTASFSRLYCESNGHICVAVGVLCPFLRRPSRASTQDTDTVFCFFLSPAFSSRYLLLPPKLIIMIP